MTIKVTEKMRRRALLELGIKLKISNGSDEVLRRVFLKGKSSVGAVEREALQFCRENKLDVLNAVEISYEVIKRSCSMREAKYFGYPGWPKGLKQPLGTSFEESDINLKNRKRSPPADSISKK